MFKFFVILTCILQSILLLLYYLAGDPPPARLLWEEDPDIPPVQLVFATSYAKEDPRNWEHAFSAIGQALEYLSVKIAPATTVRVQGNRVSECQFYRRKNTTHVVVHESSCLYPGIAAYLQRDAQIPQLTSLAASLRALDKSMVVLMVLITNNPSLVTAEETMRLETMCVQCAVLVFAMGAEMQPSAEEYGPTSVVIKEGVSESDVRSGVGYRLGDSLRSVVIERILARQDFVGNFFLLE